MTGVDEGVLEFIGLGCSGTKRLGSTVPDVPPTISGSYVLEFICKLTVFL